MLSQLRIRLHGGGAVSVQKNLVRLEIPAGPAQTYRLAQLDDYGGIPRARLPWSAPVVLRLRARASAADLPGTWGFGLWNDPFSASLGLGGMSARLPALPNTAWFFSAGTPNHLALRDDHPAQGFLAATFSAPRIPSLLFAPAGLALPLLALRPTARFIRRAARLLIRESAVSVRTDPVEWHEYTLQWQAGIVRFTVDEEELLTTPVSPRPPLGLVLWIDNQYAAFPPSGRLQMGASANPTAWIECDQITINGEPAAIGSDPQTQADHTP